MTILSNFISGFKKCHSFYVRQLEMPKIAFHKSDVINLTCFFFNHCTAKNQDIDLKFCILDVCVNLDNILHYGVSDILKILHFMRNYF